MADLPLALVTGATRGIGAAAARALAPTHRLLLGGRDAGALGELAGTLPEAKPWPIDLTDTETLETATAEIGELDVLVHSAGVARLGTVETATDADWRANFEVNVLGVVTLTRLLLPALRASKGHVVVINSGAGQNARPGWGPYAASKFAVRAFADSLREEESALRVTSIYPGRTDTEMQQAIVADEGRAYEPERFLRPESVAAAVLAAVSATGDAHPTDVTLRPRGLV
ncbi:NADP-dependent 3-hydroxy acid dehydrogenase YdfG [Amycolatopsis lurida]|uniref:Short-chain dehydrogenase n=1 Tax=Amycolatopsis lurida NRRL 2430 TaxID=1460371 RepID=A0A2P2FQX6_AMYLU|nr:SDR family oxidoreductase [Amycolatopsis lurida]KFU79090.1 short-chain dehydrogenase [Amycolatopsis lurida NRRL 2430]SED72389.1 NADP-dependent 3-hydroxy acid dehydrogenase YdfG [Amycolatopsis lurida]